MIVLLSVLDLSHIKLSNPADFIISVKVKKKRLLHVNELVI